MHVCVCIYIYAMNERLYICHLLLGHVQHVLHHLNLAAASKKTKKSKVRALSIQTNIKNENKYQKSAPLAFIHSFIFRRRSAKKKKQTTQASAP